MEKEKKRLTIDDPVDRNTLKELSTIREHRRDLGEKAIDMLQDLMHLLVTDRSLDRARSRVFEQVLIDRGLPTDTVVEVDPSTGKLSLVGPPQGSEEEESEDEGSEDEVEEEDHPETP